MFSIKSFRLSNELRNLRSVATPSAPITQMYYQHLRISRHTGTRGTRARSFEFGFQLRFFQLLSRHA